MTIFCLMLKVLGIIKLGLDSKNAFRSTVESLSFVGVDNRRFRGSPLPTNLRPNEHLKKK